MSEASPASRPGRPPGPQPPERREGCKALLGCLLIFPVALLVILVLIGAFSPAGQGRRILWWIEVVLACLVASLCALLVFTLASFLLTNQTSTLVLLAQGIIAGCFLLVGIWILFLGGYFDQPRPRLLVAPFFRAAGLGFWFALALGSLILAQVLLPGLAWVFRLPFCILTGIFILPLAVVPLFRRLRQRVRNRM